MFALQVLNKALLIFGPTTSLFYVLGLFLSPVSPVFHTVVTVRIGLKTHLEWEHPFHNIRCLCWSA